MASISSLSAPGSAGAGPLADRAAGLVTRAGLWPLRLVWLAAPLGIGVGLYDRLDHFPATGAVIAEVTLWAAWFAGLVACLVPSTQSLTVVRIGAPGALALVLLAGLVGDGGFPAARLEALGYGALLSLVAFLPTTGDRMINGSAYGSERRMALRPPAFALLGPVQVTWLLVFAGVVTGPVLLANEWWIAGVVACVAGAFACRHGFRVLHQLARRWIVFVPAGFVIHDRVLLVESILLRRAIVAALGPAREGDDATSGAADVSGGARGLALEVAARERVAFGRRVKGTVVNTEADRVVFTPSLPGAVLTEARIRAIRIADPGIASVA
ncbi:MAG: hypothetical protein OEY41_17650, partial [Acidimicrobiia bacterium]|nr:hypothetical protein [Acidimicrobiia bacterium]